MTQVKSLIAAIDFSEDSRNAASRAYLLATELGARIELLHVVSDSSLQAMRGLAAANPDLCARVLEKAESIMAELATELDPGGKIAASISVRLGTVLDEILAASKDFDILLLGVRGWNPLRDILLGTTADRLLRIGTRPVLVVKRSAQGPYRRVIVPVDFTPHSAVALRMALIVAPEADITLVHAYDVPLDRKLWLADVPEEKIEEFRNEARRKALENVVSLRKEFGMEQQRIFHYLENGDPGSVILGREASSGADLIVIGKRKRSYAGELLLGSATRHVLSGAKCDVMVVHE